MTQATINLAKGELARSAAGLVYGGLFVQIDEIQFPNSQWTDFVVIVLAWWCRGLSQLLGGEREQIEVRFMEGPYLAEIGPRTGPLLHLALIEAGLSRRIRREADVATDELVDSVLSAAMRVLAECKTRSWWSDDADDLADAARGLQREKLRLIN